MTTQLTFQNVALTTISRNNQTYISASDLANALQYADSRAITKIYTRNQDEFTPDMSLVVNLTTKGYGNGNSEKEQRIFSLRGCHLVAMFSRTPVAKEFRKWVLDILDKEVSQNVEEIRPLVEQPELLSLLIRSYHFLHQAHEFRNKAVQTTMGAAISQQLGGHYLYNFDMPLQQHLTEIKAFIHSSNERLMFVEGMLDLLSQPQLQQQPKTQTFNFLHHR